MSCGCIKHYNILDITTYHGIAVGDSVNSLTVLEIFRKIVPNGRHKTTGAQTFSGVIHFKSQCICGNVHICKGLDVVKGNIKSCGCTHLGKRVIGDIPRTFYRYLKVQAGQRNIEFSITFEELAILFSKQKGLCALSGRHLVIPRLMKSNTRTASVDRIDSNVGYVTGNVQWVHVSVNYAKLSLSNEEFINLCRDVYLNSLNK